MLFRDKANPSRKEKNVKRKTLPAMKKKKKDEKKEKRKPSMMEKDF